MMTKAQILRDRKTHMRLAKDRLCMVEIALDNVKRNLELDLPHHADVQKLSELVRHLTTVVDVLRSTDEILQYGGMTPEERKG